MLRQIRARAIWLLAAPAVAVAIMLSPQPTVDRAEADPDDVLAGFDLFETVPSDTFQDLNLPADFFGPGCDPFVGTVFLEGVPFDSFGTFNGLLPTDTIVERKQDAGPVFPDPIPIEIVRLELKSVSPITVTCPGGDQLWDLIAEVPEIGGPVQPQGTMTIRHEFPNGGTFDSQLPVIPVLTFLRVDQPGQVGPFQAPQIDFASNNVPWCHTANPLTSPPGHVVVEVPGLTSNFFPGVECPVADMTKVLVVEDALLAQHGVRVAEIAPAVGGIAELPLSDAELSADAASAPSDSSGLSTGAWAAIVIGAAAVVIVLGGSVLYARRRVE